MRYVTFSPGGDEAPRLGVWTSEETVVDVKAAAYGSLPIPDSLVELIAAGSELQSQVSQHIAQRAHDGAAAHHAENILVHAPLRPGKIVGVGLNYIEHVDESSRSLDTAKELPERPVLFSKAGTAVVGPGEPIWHNHNLTAQLDWECELAVVIGTTAHSVTKEDALDHVFGYTITNDISARDQRRSGQWFFSKSQDSYAPLGPVVVTTDEIPDPYNLTLRLDVNGDQRQNGYSKDMLFRIDDLIADISSGMTLEPGDVIATGSPQGVGAAMDPPTYLLPGDVVSAHIENIGTLSNPVRAV